MARAVSFFCGGIYLKKILCILLSALLIFSEGTVIYAGSSSNIDSGGGGMGSGTSTDVWYGADGVRVTIIRCSDHMPVAAPIDISNSSVSDIQIYFGKVSKMSYKNGAALTAIKSGYSAYKPVVAMPRVVTSSGSNNLRSIKNYFCDEGTIRFIAGKVGASYEILTNGQYKILLEPIAYFKHGGVMYAMTATEAALFNKKSGGTLRKKMPSLSHQNLPLSMFLETSDLGFEEWTGSVSGKQTDEDIIRALGLGIVRFSDPEPEPPRESSVTYRCDTEVITSVTVSTGSQRTPKSPAYVTFEINGRTYTHSGIYLPEGGSQLAWVKWRTPSEPGTLTINVSSNCSISSSQINAKIASMNEKIPPDPKANDRNDSFTAPTVPTKADKTTLAWGEWDCWWHENWVWVASWQWYSMGHNSSCKKKCTESHGYWQDNGQWKDKGWYEYEWIPYTATLSVTASASPDEKNPTASGKTMKSGYGINLKIAATLRSSAPSSHITGAQTVVAYFPEFQYKTYYRLLEATRSGYSAIFEFQKNKYSTYNRRVHFTPPWFPDGAYTVYAQTYDSWTPAGMLQVNLTDSLTVKDSLFADWHIRPVGR